jgi:hypothetical protein
MMLATRFKVRRKKRKMDGADRMRDKLCIAQKAGYMAYGALRVVGWITRMVMGGDGR